MCWLFLQIQIQMNKIFKRTGTILLAILIGILMVIDRIILVPMVWRDVPSIDEYRKFDFLVQDMMKRISTVVMLLVIFIGFYYLITWIF